MNETRVKGMRVINVYLITNVLNFMPLIQKCGLLISFFLIPIVKLDGITFFFVMTLNVVNLKVHWNDKYELD